jgi:tetratricopeptide (TPR) repeat protein
MMISLGIIGGIYQAQERYDLSNQVYTNIIKFAEEVDDKRQTAIGLTYIGENLRRQGKFDKAINYYLHSLDILKPIRALNEIRDNYMFLTYAYQQKKDFNQCKHCYANYKAYRDSTKTN